jgi:hypothetical protein
LLKSDDDGTYATTKSAEAKKKETRVSETHLKKS